MNQQLINGDCLAAMKQMPEAYIDLTVTSPPYDDLRTYNGFSWNFEGVARELYRITKKGGVVVWVIGDQTKNGSETGSSFRQALFFQSIGFNLHDTMIYAKNNPIPQNHNRYEQCFEFMFVFSKGKPRTFNGIRVETKNHGKSFSWGNRKTKLDTNQCRRDRKEADYREVKPSKLHNNIFYYSIGGGKTGHPAVFPLQLAKDQIKTWTNEGDLVLDCFMGSGTTGIACKETDRNFIGIEIDENYYEMSKKRIESYFVEQPLFKEDP